MIDQTKERRQACLTPFECVELFSTKVLRGKGRHTSGNSSHWQKGKGHDPTR